MASKDLMESTDILASIESTDILASIEEEVTCPVCKQIPRTVPIPVCPNGHIICQPCLNKLETLVCPTCRVPILPNKFSVVAAGVASKLLHLCKFQGCKVKMTLTKVKIHELNCKMRHVECDRCHEMAPIHNFLNHNCGCFDWTFGSDVKTVMIRIGGIPNLNKLYVSRWDGKKPIVFQSSSDFKYPPAVYIMEDQVFFLGVARRREEKRWMFYAGIQGTEQDSKGYQVTVILEDQKKKNVSRSVCKVLPLEKIFNLNDIEDSGNDCFVTVHDIALQRFLHYDARNFCVSNGSFTSFIRLEVKYKIVKL